MLQSFKINLHRCIDMFHSKSMHINLRWFQSCCTIFVYRPFESKIDEYRCMISQNHSKSINIVILPHLFIKHWWESLWYRLESFEIVNTCCTVTTVVSLSGLEAWRAKRTASSSRFAFFRAKEPRVAKLYHKFPIYCQRAAVTCIIMQKTLTWSCGLSIRLKM